MKKHILILALLIMVAMPVVLADSDNYEITAVYVDSILVTDGSVVQVERGDTAQIQLFLEGTGDTTDVRVRVWMGGYAYGDIEETSDIFDVEDGVEYKETLFLEIPDDLDLEDNTYTLHVEIFDALESERQDFTLFFDAERNLVEVDDIILSSETVSPGDYLGVKVRLDNNGKNDEEDIKVTVAVPDLGISNRVYVDELLVEDQVDANTAYLTIPEEAATGSYELEVTLSFNNDYTETVESTFFRVDGDATVYDENAVVSIESIDTLEVGVPATFKIQVTNLGQETKTFYMFADGMPVEFTDSVIVTSASSGELTYTVTAESTGLQSLFVEVESDDGMVEQKLFYVDVVEEQNPSVVLFSVLVAVVLVLAILVYLRKYS